jgi:nucleotide-binding universal stress UspA family protein
VEAIRRTVDRPAAGRGSDPAARGAPANAAAVSYIVRDKAGMSESIVVGTDGSATAKRAVAEAARLAKALDAEVHLVSAYEGRDIRVRSSSGATLPTMVDDGQVDSKLAEAAASVRSLQVPFKTHAVRADPADALVDVANRVGASMIVVGNQGMHGAKRVLGSVPNSVSHKARCSVLIVSTDPDD